MQDWRTLNNLVIRSFTPSSSAGWGFVTQSIGYQQINGRFGNVTRTKEIGVKYLIKVK